MMAGPKITKGETPEDELLRAWYRIMVSMERDGILPDGVDAPSIIDYQDNSQLHPVLRAVEDRGILAARAHRIASAARRGERVRETPPRYPAGTRDPKTGKRLGGRYIHQSVSTQAAMYHQRTAEDRIFSLARARYAPSALHVEPAERGGNAVLVKIEGVGRGGVVRADKPYSEMLELRRTKLKADSAKEHKRARSLRTAPQRARARERAEATSADLKIVRDQIRTARNTEKKRGQR